MSLESVQYTASAHPTRGRGASRSDDGRLDVQLSSPATPGPAPPPRSTIQVPPRAFVLEGE